MKKRKYTKKQIRCIALQVALNTIKETRRLENNLPEQFMFDTSIYNSERDGYPYRTEVMLELLRIEDGLRKQLVSLMRTM